ncbi:MAG: hypothetical protein IPL53_18290 [Ignavibacteria bacterium]|nr:hypothetical protein [Ignavibacteria bacterium]
MKTLNLIIAVLFLSCSALRANPPSETKTTYSKKDIQSLAPKYINNNVKVKNPMIIDVDNDGNFDILKFTAKGNVEYYRNTGTLEQPFFVLENKNFDNYEVNSFLPKMLIPMFFADSDGDKDVDVFGVVKDGFDKKTFQEKYDVVEVENTAFFDNYTLITIILVLVVIVLLIAILK